MAAEKREEKKNFFSCLASRNEATNFHANDAHQSLNDSIRRMEKLNLECMHVVEAEAGATEKRDEKNVDNIKSALIARSCPINYIQDLFFNKR